MQRKVLPRAEASKAGFTLVPLDTQVAGLHVPPTIWDRCEFLGTAGVCAGHLHFIWSWSAAETGLAAKLVHSISPDSEKHYKSRLGSILLAFSSRTEPR